MRPHRSWLVRTFHSLYTFKLTWAGRVGVAIVCLSAMGVVTIEIPIHILFCFTAAVLGIVEIVGTAMRPKLRVGGRLPEKMTAGETIRGVVTVENLGFFPALDVMCWVFDLPPGLQHTDPDQMIPLLPRGKTANLPVSIHAAHRGEYSLPDIIVHSTFPLNLMRFGNARVRTKKLTVLPRYTRLEQFEIPLMHQYQAGGTLQESRTGEAPEFVGNRDYVPGEPVRRLDFRAWGRLGKPVVREYQDEFSSRVALVLDTHDSRPRALLGRPGSVEIEAAISLTAAIADTLDGAKTTIDLFAAGPDLFLFQTDVGMTHFESVLEILAAVDSTRHNPFEELTPALAESLESTSVVVCILIDWDQTREELVRRVLESGCALRVLLVRDRPCSQPFPAVEHYTRVSPADVVGGAVSSL